MIRNIYLWKVASLIVIIKYTQTIAARKLVVKYSAARRKYLITTTVLRDEEGKNNKVGKKTNITEQYRISNNTNGIY